MPVCPHVLGLRGGSDPQARSRQRFVACRAQGPEVSSPSSRGVRPGAVGVCAIDKDCISPPAPIGVCDGHARCPRCIPRRGTHRNAPGADGMVRLGAVHGRSVWRADRPSLAALGEPWRGARHTPQPLSNSSRIRSTRPSSVRTSAAVIAIALAAASIAAYPRSEPEASANCRECPAMSSSQICT